MFAFTFQHFNAKNKSKQGRELEKKKCPVCNKVITVYKLTAA